MREWGPCLRRYCRRAPRRAAPRATSETAKAATETTRVRALYADPTQENTIVGGVHQGPEIHNLQVVRTLRLVRS